MTEPTVPEAARVDLDAVRERLAEVRGARRISAPRPGEPTGNVVVQHARDIPEAIAGHAMSHYGPGVMHHARLDIWVIVLDEVDPERNGRKMIQALGEAGIAREKLAKVERERDEREAQRDQLADDLAYAVLRRDGARSERDQARAELERCRLLARTLQAANADLARQLDEMTAEAERLCGAREATVQAIEDDIAALDIEHLAAYDCERIARVVGAVFRIEEVKRLRSLLAEALDGWAEMDAMVTHDRGGQDNPRITEIRREAGLS